MSKKETSQLEELIQDSIQNLPELGTEKTKTLVKNVTRFSALTGEAPSHYFKLIKLPEVINITALSAPSIYRMAAAKELPAPVKLTSHGRSSAWVYGACILWAHDRVMASQGEVA